VAVNTWHEAFGAKSREPRRDGGSFYERQDVRDSIREDDLTRLRATDDYVRQARFLRIRVLPSGRVALRAGHAVAMGT
jgi:hypothetical protein